MFSLSQKHTHKIDGVRIIFQLKGKTNKQMREVEKKPEQINAEEAKKRKEEKK